MIMTTHNTSETESHRVAVVDGELPEGALSAANMEPEFVTRQEDVPVLKELMEREPLFHRPGFGTSRKDFEKMMAPEFWETGASGRRYSRDFCLDALEKKFHKITKDVWELRDYYCLEIAQDNYLLTYTLVRDRQTTRRATIWRRTSQDWQVVYHQGTAVEGATHS
jgi:hypothetical protein